MSSLSDQSETPPLLSCTCGIRSLDPLRHWFDCPVRTVFEGLPDKPASDEKRDA